MQKFLGTASLLFVSFVRLNSAEPGIQVSAGEWERENSIVTFSWTGSKTGHYAVEDDQKKRIPVQFDVNGMGEFVEPRLHKGEIRTYRLVSDSTKPLPGAEVEVKRVGSKLRVSTSGKLILEYQAEAGDLPRSNIKPVYRRGGYIHPVLSPSGKLITDDYATNHVHQHGIWAAWTKTEFEGRHPDFWNMGDAKGRVEFVDLQKFWSGLVYGGFDAVHRYVDLTASEPKPVLDEQWRVRAYKVAAPARPYWIFDLNSVQRCASANPLSLPKYHYGGLGFRGNETWNGKQNTYFLTSEGQTNRVKGNETTGRWCHISGKVEGQLAGVAILCHPDNFRAPQPMRLHPSEPFFCYAPSQGGDWQIAPGQVYTSRFRFVVFDGPPDAAELDRLWNDYAHPIVATVK
jgi:hypothetical protein